MDSDLALVIGLVIGVLSIPAIVAAFSDGRRPRIATITLMAAGGLVVYAISTKPGGYTINDLPRVIASVVADFT